MHLEPRHILYFSSFGHSRWGGQKSLFHLVTRIHKEEFRPYVVLPTDEEFAHQLRNLNIDVIIHRLPPLLHLKFHQNLQALWTLYKLMDRHKIDLVHTDGPRNTLYAGLAARAKRVPLVWHVRDSNRDRYGYDRLLLHLSSKVILVANAVRDRFNRAADGRKFLTIYNGLDLNDFPETDHHFFLRNKYGLEKNALLIGVMARVEYLKGQNYLIEACGIAKKALGDFHLFLIGDADDSEYVQLCLDTADKFGISERVHIMNYQTEVSGILHDMDIFVLPSLLEAFPRSILEAMASGKPVIVTNVGGCMEAIEDQISGFVVPPRDPETLADRIIALCADEELRLRMGTAARKRAGRLFSIDENVSRTEALYREMLGMEHP